jgi:hypothetical protein
MALLIVMGKLSAFAYPIDKVFKLPPGFQAELFVEGLYLPTLLDFDSKGNLFVGSNAARGPIWKITPDKKIKPSNPILDPDGVVVDSQDRVLVAGAGSGITLVNSFDGGTDETIVTGLGNLDAIDIDSKGNIVVLENERNVTWIDADTKKTKVLYHMPAGKSGDIIFSPDEKSLLIGRNSPGQITKIDLSTGNTKNIIPPLENISSSMLAGAFGRGGGFGTDQFFTIAKRVNLDTGVLLPGSVCEIKRIDKHGWVHSFGTSTFNVAITFSPSGDMFLSTLGVTNGKIFRIYYTGEPTLQEVLDNLGYDITVGKDELPYELWYSKDSYVHVQEEYSALKGKTPIGWYSPSVGVLNQIDNPPYKYNRYYSFKPGHGVAFGMYIDPPKWCGKDIPIWYTEDIRNIDNGMEHAHIYPFKLKGGVTKDDAFVLAWEDLPGGVSDKDYQDIVMSIHNVNPIPEPCTMLLMGSGLAGLAGLARRRKRS